MCYNPITISVGSGDQKKYVQVPCGHCLECLNKYQNEWTNRMTEELKSVSGHAVFFTLTYSDDNVPKNYIYDYTIFRSPTDYNFDNTYYDVDNRRTRVLPKYGRARKKFREHPMKDLIELGVDTRNCIDFNIKRSNHKEFIEQIQKIYGDYLRTFDNPTCSVEAGSDDFSYTYGELSNCFDTEDVIPMEPQDMAGDNEVLDNFTELLNDDSYISNGFDVDDVPVFSDFRYRERPIMAFNSVRKEDVQNWLKRGRKRLKEDNKEFTYFITAEYGPRTLRPHYHGILFGVDEQDVKFMFEDWADHFGFYTFDKVDESKGGTSYVSKYCSKGFFEHPLCARDFFYSRKPLDTESQSLNEFSKLREFSEYHSKHYERCIEIFGMDEPIVDPTFHLISKGMGSSYLTPEKIEYFVGDLRVEEPNDYPNGNREVYSYIDEDIIFEGDPDEVNAHNEKVMKQLEYRKARLNKIKERIKNRKQESNYEEETERFRELFNKLHYYRKNYKTGKFDAYAMPKYYRSQILNDSVRCALANFVQSENVRVYTDKFEQIRTDHPFREDIEILLDMEEQERAEKVSRIRDIHDRITKRYNKSKL